MPKSTTTKKFTIENEEQKKIRSNKAHFPVSVRSHSRELKTDFQILKFVFDVNDVNNSTKFRLPKRLSLIEPFSALLKTLGCHGEGIPSSFPFPPLRNPPRVTTCSRHSREGASRECRHCTSQLFRDFRPAHFSLRNHRGDGGGYSHNNDRTYTRPRLTHVRREDRRGSIANRTIIIL